MNKYYLLSLLIVLLASCTKEIDINKIKSKVQNVKTGNKIELKNGLTVELLGINPTANSKKYLEEHVKGKNVSLRRDSHSKRKTIKSYKTSVKAYVRIENEKGSVNGKILELDFSPLNQNLLKDSLQAFKGYVNPDNERRILAPEELLTYMKPATFAIFAKEDGKTGMGTGFFISETGLALTNNHVFNYNSEEAVICFFGENGHLNTSNTRNIEKILFTYGGDEDNQKIDFTVFQVRLNNDEKVSYMPLVKQHINEGTQIAKIGCPASNVCNFQTGILSNYNEGYLTHSISSNHGDSGGPVVNMRGEVVGINQSIEFNEALSRMTGTVQKAEGIAFAVDAVLVRRVLDKEKIKYGR